MVLSKEKLVEGISIFLKYFEDKHNYNTDSSILEDLAKFQVFLLTTRDELKDIKSEQFNFDWKNFFVKNKELKSQPTNYFYKNLITEKDPFSWATETIWFGRFTQKYKFSPEYLQEGKVIMNLSRTI